MTREKMLLPRAEVAQKLLALAGELERGAVVFQNRKIPVADHVRLEIKADADELEVELKWNAAEANQRPATERLLGPDEPDRLW
jgi:amphi-Trp domain-containing protein